MNKIIVCQVGARHRYLIPKLMYKAGMLSCLYTDSCKYSLLGKIASVLQQLGFVNGNIGRLANRNPEIPRSLVKTSDALFLKKLSVGKDDAYAKIDITYQSLSNFYIRQGVEKCDVVYNMFFENIEFLRFAKSKGKKVVVDIYENPTAFADMENEVAKIPEYNKYSSIRELYLAENKIREKYMNEVLGIADYYTIPSKFVKDSLDVYPNFDESKVKMLPYPSSITKDSRSYAPIRHKLIWVGNDPVRKGLIYCAKAATILKRKYPDLNFEIIGVTDSALVNDPSFKDLNFLGVLNKQQLIHEYETAEAYVFPTLYEGLAGTVIEAACCGCPIITTHNAGVEEGKFPAMYIPIRDVDAIVKAVEQVFSSKDLQNELSKSVFEFANKEYSQKQYETNLVRFFLPLLSSL